MTSAAQEILKSQCPKLNKLRISALVHLSQKVTMESTFENVHRGVVQRPAFRLDVPKNSQKKKVSALVQESQRPGTFTFCSTCREGFRECACVFVCVCGCMYMSVCLFACMYVYTYLCMYLCMYVCMYPCMYLCMYLFYLSIYLSIHAYISQGR